MDVAKRALEIAKKLGAEAAEVFHGRSIFRAIDVEKDILKPQLSETEGIAIRVAKNKNISFSYTFDLGEEAITRTIKTAIRSAELKGEDPNYVGFPSFRSITSSHISEDIQDIEISQLGKIYDEIHGLLKEEKKVVLVGGGVTYIEGHYRILNTEGIDSVMEGNAIIVGAYALTREIPPNHVYRFVVERKSDVEVNKIVDDILRKAERITGCKDVSYVGEPEIIFAPQALGMMLTIFLRQVDASQIKVGMSPYTKENLGQEIANKNLTIIDDPTNMKSLIPTEVDFEGVPAKRKPIVESGKLTTILNDYYHAKLLNIEPSANAVRFSLFGMEDPVSIEPRISPWFITFEGKEKPLDEIIGETRNGFLIENVMGVHQADPASGKFSVPALAVRIENGELKYPVRKVMLSGMMRDILQNVDVISKEREEQIFGDFPYLRTRGMKASAEKPPLGYRIKMKMANILLRLGVIKF